MARLFRKCLGSKKICGKPCSVNWRGTHEIVARLLCMFCQQGGHRLLTRAEKGRGSFSLEAIQLVKPAVSLGSSTKGVQAIRRGTPNRPFLTLEPESHHAHTPFS